MKRDLLDAEHFCHICTTKMAKAKVVIQDVSVRAWECRKCKETVLYTEDAQKAFAFNKLEKGEDLVLRAEDESRFEVKVG